VDQRARKDEGLRSGAYPGGWRDFLTTMLRFTRATSGPAPGLAWSILPKLLLRSLELWRDNKRPARNSIRRASSICW